jgi:hypothetical protein
LSCKTAFEFQKFEIRTFQTTSDGETTKINFVDLEKVIKQCSWQLFDLKTSYHAKLRLNFKILKFKFWKRPRMEKLSKLKV